MKNDKNRHINNIIIVTLSWLFLLGLSGCGPTEEATLSQNSIVISTDHKVDTYISEDFDTSVYSDIELMDFVGKEIDSYNAVHPGAVTLNDAKLEEGKVKLSISYSSLQACNDNMNGILFVGTVGDAIDLGIDMNVSLYKVGAGIRTVGKNDFPNMRDEKLIIVNGKYTLRVPGKVKYYSQWMDLLDDNTVQPLQDKGDRYFVIYE